MADTMTTNRTAAQSQAIDDAVAQARDSYTAARPLTRELHERACAVLPGGNTRTVLYHRPFPLRIARAFDAIVEDVDGHQYVDLLGEYSAGLYGHSHPVVTKAMADAPAEGISRGAHTRYEIDLAEAICARYPSIERIRFTNSGTEGNLMAVTAARAFTGRERIVAFNGGYHGSLLTFKKGAAGVNAPYPTLIVEYNDTAAVRAIFAENASSIACVLVEPMQGSSGCIPGDPAFLAALREETTKAGALQGRLGITPDLTTLGKYIGGGSSFGAFGGRADVMELFDPTRPGALPHAGTFNNNVLSMAAGHAGLTQVYTPEAAQQHTAKGDRLRETLNAIFEAAGAPFQATGVGTLLAIHPTASPIRS